jgi:hypothetical protein
MSGEERDCAFSGSRSGGVPRGPAGGVRTSGYRRAPVQRLVRAWKQDGDAGLVSRQRGQPSNNRMKDDQRCRIAALLRDRMYRGFGATLMAETLLEREGVEVSVETIRQMQIGLGLWRPKARRAKRVFQILPSPLWASFAFTRKMP